MAENQLYSIGNQSFFEVILINITPHLKSSVKRRENNLGVYFRVATSLINRNPLPQSFCLDVRKKILEMCSEDEMFTLDHENHALFKVKIIYAFLPGFRIFCESILIFTNKGGGEF